MKHPSLALLLLCTIATAACQREESSPPDADIASPAPESHATQPAPPLAEGADMVYACADSTMRVVYAQGQAHLTLADGREFALPRSQQPGEPGEEVYAGEAMILRRLGSVIELRQRGREMIQCSESSGTA